MGVGKAHYPWIYSGRRGMESPKLRHYPSPPIYQLRKRNFVRCVEMQKFICTFFVVATRVAIYARGKNIIPADDAAVDAILAAL